MAILLLGGCLDNGSTYAPPENFTAVAGDGRVTLTWTPNSVDYWVFSATDPSLTAFNWVSLPNAHAYTLVYTPLYLCGLLIGDQYYFAANGRTSGGPGGPSSPTLSAAPYDASTRWAAGSIGSATDLYGVGYASLWTCFNNPTTSGAGTFAAVGAGGAIYTSDDGKSWVNRPAPAGFTSDLYAVTGYTSFPNYPANIPPYLPIAPQFWVAVGKGGNSLFSVDGINWQLGGSVSNSLNGSTTTQNLNAITQFNGLFVAVGDQGTIMLTSWALNGGLYWQKAFTQPSTQNLHGVAHGSLFVAVGDNGTILLSGDGSNWYTPQAVQLGVPVITSNLRQVAVSLTGIIVAVGDNGTIVTSTSNGANWVKESLPGGITPNLISVTVENQVFANALADTSLGNIVPSTEFVAMDSNGNVYNSVNGVNWKGPFTTGITSPNAMVSSGFGYVAAGPGGTTAYAF
jgi:photosystem II stability/assembly factor-like uncharacterized protein